MDPQRVVPRWLNPDLNAVLEQNVDRELQRLESLPRWAWWARWRQRERLLDAERDMDWSKTRLMGRDRFVWRQGVGGWGLVIFVASQIVLPLERGHLPHSFGELLPHLLIGGLVWAVGGYWYGVWVWAATERRFLSNTFRGESKT